MTSSVVVLTLFLSFRPVCQPVRYTDNVGRQYRSRDGTRPYGASLSVDNIGRQSNVKMKIMTSRVARCVIKCRSRHNRQMHIQARSLPLTAVASQNVWRRNPTVPAGTLIRRSPGGFYPMIAGLRPLLPHHAYKRRPVVNTLFCH